MQAVVWRFYPAGREPRTVPAVNAFSSPGPHHALVRFM
jgi:hypothetical protein